MSTFTVPANLVPYFQQASAQYGVPVSLLEAQDFVESTFNPNAVSPAGAEGISQFLPSTFSAYGSGSPFNAQDDIDAQAKYMSTLDKQYGSWQSALEAYNSGSPTGAPSYASEILGDAGNLLGGLGNASGPTAGEQTGNSAASIIPNPLTPIVNWFDQWINGSNLERAALLIVGTIVVLIGLFVIANGPQKLKQVAPDIAAGAMA